MKKLVILFAFMAVSLSAQEKAIKAEKQVVIIPHHQYITETKYETIYNTEVIKKDVWAFEGIVNVEIKDGRVIITSNTYTLEEPKIDSGKIEINFKDK